MEIDDFGCDRTSSPIAHPLATGRHREVQGKADTRCYVLFMNSSRGSGVRPTTGDRLEGVEGLRAIAAGSVLVYHTWIIAAPSGAWADAGPLAPLLPDLSFGVVLFFTLSGFLLYRPFVAGLLGHRPHPQFARYLRNRFLRIAPAYIVILLSAALVLRHVLVRDEA